MVDLPREPYFDNKISLTSSNPKREVDHLYSNEVDGLLRLLRDQTKKAPGNLPETIGRTTDLPLSEPIRNAICKYLTVTIFAALDYFFRNSVKVLIDKYNLNIESLFPIKSRPRLQKMIQHHNTTIGAIVASTYRLYDIYEIDFVFSNLFQMDSFLDYLIKQNDIDQTRFALDGHPLPIEYHKLTEAYKWRNNIAHEVIKIKVSKSRTIAMWDNLGNIIDLSKSFFHSLDDADYRKTLDSLYKKGKNKMIKNALYKLCSDKIMSELLKNKKSGNIRKRSDIAKAIESISNLNSLTDYVNVESKMRIQGLVSVDSDSIALTIKGEKRLKRTSRNERDKWKREVSPIVCSWLIR